ncbi:SF1B family DNA helicase RecD2 [Desulfocicer niacini]
MVNSIPHIGVIQERLEGIVDRVTFHNPDNGWSILKVTPFNAMGQETVVVHQTRVFAGATMVFEGSWTVHPKFGRQFQAVVATEKKPATLAALEKYLGSGLIKGVGPKTARKIVKHFKQDTLNIFETQMESLTQIPGIAQKKLEMIRHAWTRHKSIREVMMFLQTHGISTLFAVRIYKTYGDKAIAIVTEDPYRLANDFYGIGFFSADKVALSIGLDKDSPRRIMAGIRHVVAAGRNDGHCYLTLTQINESVKELLELDIEDQLATLLDHMVEERQLMVRELPTEHTTAMRCYYARSLYFDERYVARRVAGMGPPPPADLQRIQRWIDLFCKTREIKLSHEQAKAVGRVVCEKFSILTGGPGCGKTTTTQVIVKLAEAMGLKVLLAAPTGRAAQRMGEVIGREAKTIHRLLEWKGGEFKKNESQPLDTDFLIVDECSMLDISLTASLLKAVPMDSRVLFIGDADQLPSVGAGNVLKDIISADTVPCFRLTQIFRQARESKIIQYAHQINRGEMPWVISPFKKPSVWQDGSDCMFMDSDEATGEQLRFIDRVKRLCTDHLEVSGDSLSPGTADPEALNLNVNKNQKKDKILTPENIHENKERLPDHPCDGLPTHGNDDHEDAPLYEFRINETVRPYETELTIPAKFQHVDLNALARADSRVAELTTVLKKVHPWSSLHYGYAALDVVTQLYLTWIPKYFGREREIQILSPMTRGSLGTSNLNRVIQNAANPFREGKPQLKVGERIFRCGDRVIHRRNNYDLGVFNGDIGTIIAIDNSEPSLTVAFYPDQRQVFYQRDDIMELDLAWAITIHKSQGSEFEVVIIPVLTQHYKMLYRNLLYTGLTRAKKLAVFVGTRKAMSMAVRNQDVSQRQTALDFLLQKGPELFE